MSIADLYDELKRYGIILKMEEGKLCYYPKEAVTTELLAILASQKTEILAYLRKR